MTTSSAPRTLGHYEILHQLVTGGMGEVLLARRLGAGGFEKLVAVKTLRGELRADPALRTMFLDEAQLLARLDHAAIAQIHDFGEDGDVLFLVMEYVPGIAFRELVRAELPPEVAALAIAEALRGLHAAHELTDLAGTPLGVVHRDVTPENLMLTFDGRVKVLDFGIALVRGRRAPVTEHGSIKGKPPYLSPEQVRGAAIDRRSDVFSAALVLHELLTGAPVFAGESVYQIARAIEHGVIVPPSASRAGLPPRLDDIVMCALAREPDARFATAAAMAEALETVARAAAAPSLPRFAASALTARRATHLAWLQEVLQGRRSALSDGAAVGRPAGRMTAPMTAASMTAAIAGGESMTAAIADGEPSPPSATADVAAAPAAAPPPRRSSAYRHRRALGIAALLAMGVALWLVGRGAGDATEAAIVIDAAVADDARALVAAAEDAAARIPLPIDAGPVAPSPADAAAARDASPGRAKRDAGGHARDAAAPKTAPADAAIAAATGVGFLTVGATPYALVTVDGQDFGPTPFFDRPVAVGSHQVVLRAPDSNEVVLRRTVTIEFGKVVKVIIGARSP